MKFGEKWRTGRGLSVVDFDDSRGSKCQMQQSSAVGDYYDSVICPGSSFVWIGKLDKGRMHLNREQVRGLIDQLQTWLDTGDFK